MYFQYLDALIAGLNADPSGRFNAFYSSPADYMKAKLGEYLFDNHGYFGRRPTKLVISVEGQPSWVSNYLLITIISVEGQAG